MSDTERILAHVAAKDGPLSDRRITHIVPPDPDTDVAIHVIEPRTDRDHYTLFTTGLSDRPMPTPTDMGQYRHAELLINLPADWKLPEKEFRNDEYHWPIEWLFKIAYFPHSHGTWLGGAFTIFADEEPPPPIAANTLLSSMMLVADKDDWGRVQCENDKEVFFYTLMPIYTEERDLELKEGITELIHRFHVYDIPDVVDVDRQNVAKTDIEGWFSCLMLLVVAGAIIYSVFMFVSISNKTKKERRAKEQQTYQQLKDAAQSPESGEAAQKLFGPPQPKGNDVN